ncbi:MAG: preprotein translocase subunit SecG [Bacillales bacterium]|jgi:preprotein translocase subunit SecG|nr:preprotein translocase subunit SecG [Bacillales bacterium]
MVWLDWVLAVLALLMIILVMLQAGKSQGASGAIMGGNSKVFTNTKERGTDLILSRLTLGVGIALFVLIICRGIWF